MRHTLAIAAILSGLASAAFAQTPSELTVQGPGHEAVHFDAAALAALPPFKQSVVIAPEHGHAAVEWSGPLLWSVLVAAHAIDPAKFAQEVREIVRVQGADGYVATFVVAEFAPDFAARPFQVATAHDGTALSTPRLIVPQEKRGGRSVRDVVRIDVQLESSGK